MYGVHELQQAIVPTAAMTHAMSDACNWLSNWWALPSNNPEPSHVALRILEDRIDELAGEDAGQQRSQRAARPVNPKCVKTIVVAEDGLDLGYHEEADHAGKQSDQPAPAWERQNPPPE